MLVSKKLAFVLIAVFTMSGLILGNFLWSGLGDEAIAGEAVTVSLSCGLESDGGRDILVAGEVTDLDSGDVYVDECRSDVSLVEFFCNPRGALKAKIIDCSRDGLVCEDGACVEGESCTDSDGGLEYYTGGITGNGTQDLCQPDGDYLFENYCDGDSHEYDFYRCSDEGLVCLTDENGYGYCGEEEDSTVACDEEISVGESFYLGGTEFYYHNATNASFGSSIASFTNEDSVNKIERSVTYNGEYHNTMLNIMHGGTTYYFNSTESPYWSGGVNYDIILTGPCS